MNTDVTPIERLLLQADHVGNRQNDFKQLPELPRIRSYMSPYDRQQASTAQQEFNELQVELSDLTAQANYRGTWLNGNLPLRLMSRMIFENLHGYVLTLKEILGVKRRIFTTR